MKTILYKLIVLSIMAVLVLSANAYSQIDKIQFERISTESGLSQSSVLSICQDHKGFLWFGTYEGLNRYDGYGFKVYKADPEDPYSLSNNNIECIIEDHLGVLWIGTEEGLNRFDRNNEQFVNYRNDPNDPNSLSNNFVRYIYEDRSGTIWVATYGGGLNQFDRNKEIFIQYSHDPGDPESLSHDNVLSILEDSHGNLWIGTDGGLNLFDREKGRFICYQHDPRDPTSLSHDGVWRIFEDRAGNLWIGTWGGGLNRFDPKTERFTRYQNNSNDPHSISHDVVRSIWEDPQGNLWIGTGGGGLNILSPDSDGKNKHQFIHYQADRDDPCSLSGNSILSIFQDRSGILWLGTDFCGINKFNPDRRRFAHYRNDPNDSNSVSSNSITAVFEDSRGIIWIGTNDGGLTRFDRKKNQFTHYVHNPRVPTSLSNNVVRSICEDRHERLWIATDSGLNRFDPVRKEFIRCLSDEDDPTTVSHSDVWSLYKDRTGNLWVGTVIGLNRFEYETEEFVRYVHDDKDPNSLSDDFIWSIHEDRSGMFWIGTNTGGLNGFDPGQGVFIHYKDKTQDSSGLSDSKVLCIHEDRTGAIWFGTSDRLNKWDRDTKTFSHYSIRDGLPSNTIQGILEDDHGNLWISTNNGLSKFDPHTESSKNYYESNGLQSSEFGVNACCKLRSGEMIFGGINGFNIFHPDSIRDNLEIPAVVITNLQISNKPVSVGEIVEGRTILKESISESEGITLSYKHHAFSFEFAALHYASPKDNLYAYMMEGFEKEWNYTDANRRFASYTNLLGGDYTFRVKASNNDGVWNAKGTALRITITPPFWQTWWFKVIVITAVLFLLVAAYRIRTHAIRERAFQLERRVEERTAELKIANEGLEQEIAERKRTAETLRTSEEKYRKLFEGAQDGIVLADVETGVIIDCNRAAAELVGRKKSELIGQHQRILHPPEEVGGEFNEAFQQHLKQKQGKVLETRAITKRGKIKDVAIKASLFELEGKKITQSLVRDITEHRRVEEELAEERNLLRTLIEILPDRIYAKDTKSRFLIVNMAVSRRLGTEKPDDVVGKTDFDFYPRELAEHYYADDQAVIQSDQPLIDREEPSVDSDGNPKWTLTSKVPLRNSDGEVIGLVGIGHDITKQKQAEEALRESEKRFREMFDEAPVGYHELDAEGRFARINKTELEMLGFVADEMIGEYAWKFIADKKSARQRILAKLAGTIPPTQGGERIFQRKNQTTFPVVIEDRLLRDDDSKITGIRTTVQDITERKRAEENQARLLRELESANQELNDFAYVVSHDLKAPLRAIGSLSEWIATDYAEKLDETGKEQLKLLTSRVTRMRDLIDGILQYSRVGRLKDEKVEVDLNRVVFEVIDMIDPPKNIKIEVKRKLPSITFERTRIEQLFQNVISNAVQYMDKSKGEVVIDCVADNGYWKFSVADNGPGIEEKYFPKIFQMFQTLAPRDEVESTGVGLALVKKIVETNGGKIWVESEVGAGSTFYVELPR